MTVCLLLYAAAVGGAAVPITIIAKTDTVIDEPDRMPLAPTLIFVAAGAVAALLMVWPLARRLAEAPQRPRFILVWVAVGFGFGVLFPFLSGALLSLATVFVSWAAGAASIDQVPSLLLSALLRTPVNAVTHGVLGLYTGLLAGAALALGSWVIDALNAVRDRVVAGTVTWTVTLALSVTVLVLAFATSPDLLVRLG